MGQPAQIKSGLPDGSYSVIDNGAPGVTSTNNIVGANGGSGNWTGSGASSGGFDLAANGAIAQGQNIFSNGTVPDFVIAQKTIAGISVAYKNPS